MALTETHDYRVRKNSLSYYFNLSNYLTHIAQLLIRKFYCFSPGPRIFFEYVRHNHQRYPMMGELSLET